MTSPKNREQLVTAIARVIDDKNDFDWNACVEDANAILAALEAAGCAVVPVDATGDMLNAYSSAIHYWLDEIGEDADVFKAMLAASPYRKGGE